jgi:rhomboid protease GluP
MLRHLRDDLRDFPATMTLGALWVVVFVLMLMDQMVLGPGVTFGQFIIGLRGGHEFGELTLRELFAGEVWRTLTATFVHYGLLHLGMNLYAFYFLGSLVESWYGPGPFVAIYVLTGGVGNLLSGLVRRALHWNPSIPSGGGSVVVMGLVGLCAVVGWQSRTRMGQYLRNQMIVVIVLTAGLGLALPLFGLPIIDNWGHACGTLVGAAIGLANRLITLQVGRRTARWAGRLGTLALAASAAAQVADDRRESLEKGRTTEQARQRVNDDDRYLLLLKQVQQLYDAVALPHAVHRGTLDRSIPNRPPAGAADPDPDRELYTSVVRASLRAFDSMRPALETGPLSADVARVRQILEQSLDAPPTLEELREFADRITAIRESVLRDRARNQLLTGSVGRRSD